MKKPTASPPVEKNHFNQFSLAQLVEMVLGLQKIIEQLQEKLAIAQGQSQTNSQTSSKPPSSDLIQKSEKPRVNPEEEQKKKPGGQPGHQGQTRKGFGRVDRYQISRPEVCHCCGSRELSEVINCQRQQVACLVAKPIEVVEYQTESCQCLECGAVVAGQPAEGIVPGQDLSVNLQALLAWLGNYGHLSYAKLQELLWELGEISVGVGTLQKTNQRVADAVEPAINDLWEWATLQPNVHVEETPRCVMGVKEWLWTASGEGFCLFHAADTRGRVELETMLGTEFAGVLSSDVPPDHNLAERSLRLAVTKRKVSGGSRSMKRFEQTANLLSVIQTCRFQAGSAVAKRGEKSAIAFFRAAISAHSCDLAMPSLIPIF